MLKLKEWWNRFIRRHVIAEHPDDASRYVVSPVTTTV